MQGERGRLPPIRDCGRHCVCVGASVGGDGACHDTPEGSVIRGAIVTVCRFTYTRWSSMITVGLSTAVCSVGAK